MENIQKNNAELAGRLAAAHDLSKGGCQRLCRRGLCAIANAAAEGEEITLNGFGKFKVKDAPAREGRNPSTGATIQIAASRKLSFAPAKAVNDKSNG